MTTVPNGIVGGLLAAIVAVGLTPPIAGLRVSGRATASNTRVRPRSRRWTVGLSVVYGAVAGGLFLVLELYVFGVLGVPPGVLEALGSALLWSAVLCAGWLAVRRVAPGRLDAIAADHLVVFHLVFGVGLGLWIRVTWIT